MNILTITLSETGKGFTLEIGSEKEEVREKMRERLMSFMEGKCCSGCCCCGGHGGRREEAEESCCK